jgi:hypothetical protein
MMKNNKRDKNQRNKVKKLLLRASTFRLDINAIKDGENECPICYEEFQADQNIIRLPCNEKHFFHSDCIGEWVSRK